ncbi:MAG: DUF4091 domain-containing protein [Clostridia bacterium]|nr:DUF4091 domain-containing protein [Clostridia bacterium]
MTNVKITNEAFRLKYNLDGVQPPALDGLVCARNDSAAFQIVLQSDSQYSVNVGTTEWFSRKLHLRGPHERLRVAVKAPFETEVCLEGMMTDQDDIEKADLLLAQDVIECKGNLPSAVWAEVKVPKDAAAGEYAVTVTVFRSGYGEDEEIILSEQIPLTVAEYVLPDPKDWKFYLNLWQHLSSVARHHDVKLWSDAHFTVLAEYVKAIAALGQKSITLCAGEIPWGGQACTADREHPSNLFEYSIVPITKKADGTFSYDFTKMQRYIDLCTEAGMSGDIEIFGLVNVWQQLTPTQLCEGYPERIVLRYMNEADGRICYIRDAEQVKDYLRALEAYFQRTHQIERVRIGADEPGDVDRYRETLALLKEVAPSFKCSTAINHAEFIEEFSDQIDTSAPYLGCVTKEYDKLIEHKAAFPHKKLLWYTCGYYSVPNNCLINPLTDNRMVGPLTDWLKMDGFLRWDFCLYSDDPRKDIRYSAFGTGDMNFVYPAANGKVLLSLRYKNLQRGIGDYELLRALREKDPAAADNALKKVLRIETLADLATSRNIVGKAVDKDNPAAPFSKDWNDYNNMKREILNQLK